MQPGDLAPDFTLPDDQGVERTLSAFLADGPVVLFFYPAAMTSGCTAEAATSATWPRNSPRRARNASASARTRSANNASSPPSTGSTIHCCPM